jgi:hypothetical protein
MAWQGRDATPRRTPSLWADEDSSPGCTPSYAGHHESRPLFRSFALAVPARLRRAAAAQSVMMLVQAPRAGNRAPRANDGRRDALIVP